MDDSIKTADCIHCGRCTDHCLFLNAYGIELSEIKALNHLAYHCFMCGQCKNICPKDIDGQRLVLKMRQQKVANNKGKLPEKGFGLIVREKQNYLFKNYKDANASSVLFLGCNFPSLYPETSKKLVALLKRNAGIGIIYDCCGKPISDLGLKTREEAIISRINQKLGDNHVKELVMVCPNCYYYLKPKLQVPVITIYEKLKQLGLGHPIEKAEINLLTPCPDKESHFVQKQIQYFLTGEFHPIQEVQCCGLGGCAGVKEPELAKKMPRILAQMNYKNVDTYCASCAGNLVRNGCENVHHLLVDILNTKEQPDIKKSLQNRMKMKFN